MREELKSLVGQRWCFWTDVDSTGKSTVLFIRLEFLKLHNYVNTAYLQKPSDPFNHLRVFLFIHPFWSRWKHQDFYQLLCKRENFQPRLTAALWSEVGLHFEEFYVILYPRFLEIEWLHMWKKLVCVCDSGRSRAGCQGSVSATLLGCTWPAGIPAPRVFDESFYLGAVQTTVTCLKKTPRTLLCHTVGTLRWKMFSSFIFHSNNSFFIIIVLLKLFVSGVADKSVEGGVMKKGKRRKAG